MRVLHLITGLQVGGAELALLRLVAATDRSAVDVSVAALSGGGAVAAQIAQLGVPVTSFDIRNPVAAAVAPRRIASHLRDQKIDVLQTWMHHADLLGGVAGRLARVPTVWNLRMGYPRAGFERRSTRIVARLNLALVARIPHAIVACSDAVAEDYVARGYPRGSIFVIPNGYGDFPIPAVESNTLRATLGVPAEGWLVGRVGRWHPMKDYRSFLEAGDILLRKFPQLHLALVGEGLEYGNAELRALLERVSSPERIHLLGRRSDMPVVYGALDLLCSSSAAGEGFPNVVAEAMMAARPVVSTDVGGSSELIADRTLIVPPRNPHALASAVERVLESSVRDRRELGERLRRHVLQFYGVEAMASTFTDLHRSLITH